MRYYNVESIDFDGTLIKDIRDIEDDLTVSFNCSLKGEQSLDELAYRVWGIGFEMQVYKIYDLNADRIAAFGGDLSKIGHLRIPSL